MTDHEREGVETKAASERGGRTRSTPHLAAFAGGLIAAMTLATGAAAERDQPNDTGGGGGPPDNIADCVAEGTIGIESSPDCFCAPPMIAFMNECIEVEHDDGWWSPDPGGGGGGWPGGWGGSGGEEEDPPDEPGEKPGDEGSGGSSGTTPPEPTQEETLERLLDIARAARDSKTTGRVRDVVKDGAQCIENVLFGRLCTAEPPPEAPCVGSECGDGYGGCRESAQDASRTCVREGGLKAQNLCELGLRPNWTELDDPGRDPVYSEPIRPPRSGSAHEVEVYELRLRACLEEWASAGSPSRGIPTREECAEGSIEVYEQCVDEKFE